MSRNEFHQHAYQQAMHVCRMVCDLPLDVDADELSDVVIVFQHFRRMSNLAFDAIVSHSKAAEPHGRVADALDEIRQHADAIRALSSELFGVALVSDQLLRALQGTVTLKAPDNAGQNASVKVEYTPGKYDEDT